MSERCLNLPKWLDSRRGVDDIVGDMMQARLREIAEACCALDWNTPVLQCPHPRYGQKLFHYMGMECEFCPSCVANLLVRDFDMQTMKSLLK